MNKIFLSDNETKTDLLYYESIAKVVVELVKSDPEKPISLGIHGDWGAGKSSVLAMIEQSLDSDGDVLCLRFNGWLFQGFEDAKTVLLESIVEGMMEARPAVGEVKAKAKALFKKIDWFKVAKKTGGLVLSLGTGLPLGGIVDGISDKIYNAVKNPGEVINAEAIKGIIETGAGLLKEDEVGNMARQIHQFRKDFEDFIKTVGIKRLVILVDDLDRCLPETAIETLEAAKLFLFLPHVAFIVAADEGMIEYSVKQHFPDMPIGPAGASYARAYLEKLIQVPFRIPALGDGEIHAYIALLMSEAMLGSDSGQFNNLLSMAREKLKKPWEGGRLSVSDINAKFPGVGDKVRQAITLSDQLSSVLARGTQGNPRQVKRFLNSLMLREAIARARGLESLIKRPVLAKIMLAERFHPDFYSDLCVAANLAPDGKVRQIQQLETSEEEDGEGKIPKKRLADAAWDKWHKDEGIQYWAGLTPSLDKEDLRAYVFVTRDKKAAFGGQAGGPLDAIVEQLMGPKIQVSGQVEKIRKLSPNEAGQIFEKLRSRILSEDSFEDTTNGDGPSGFPGMVVMTTAHQHLQTAFVSFLSEAPIGKLRVWAAKHGIKFTGEAETAWNILSAKWIAQKDNNSFSAAVKAMSSTTKRK